MPVLEAYLFLAVPGAAVLYLLYFLAKKSEEKRWERGTGRMPDIPRLRMKFLIVFVVLQVFNALLVTGMANFPGQR